MNQIHDNGKDAVTNEIFQSEVNRSVVLGLDKIKSKIQSMKGKLEGKNATVTVATFSRSGTLAKILQPIINEAADNDDYLSFRIVCAQSTPGDEGELMAQDLNCDWVADDDMYRMIEEGNKIDLIVIGSDCVLEGNEIMINKIGTKKLCEVAQKFNIPVYCCVDRWKVWDDNFPPPIEEDLFEIVPLNLISDLLLPAPSMAG